MEATEALDPSMKASTHSQHVALGRLRALKCKTKRLSSILMSADVVVPDWARRSPWDGVYTTKAVAMARSSDSARDIGGEAGSGSSSDAQDEDGFRDEGALTSADAGVRSSSIEKSDGRLRRKKACGRKKIRMSNSRFRRDDCLLELTRGHYKGPYNGDDDKNASSSGTKPKPRRSVNLARVLTLDKPANESEDDFEYLSTVIKETSCTKMQLLSGTIDSHEESSPELSPQCTLGMQEDSGSTGRVEAAAFQNDENEVSRGKGKKDSSEVQDKEGRVVVSGHVGSFDLNATPSSSDVEKEEDGKQIFDFDLTVKDPSSNIHDIEEKKYRGHEKLLSCDDIEGKNETCARQRGVDCKGGEAVIGSNERHCTMRYFKRRKNFKKNGGDNTKPLVAMDNEYVKKTSPSATGMLGTDEVERTMKYFRRKNFKKKSCENYKPHLAIEDEEAKKTSTSVNEKVQIGYSETLNSDSSDYLPISYMRRKGKKVLERTDQDSTDTWEPDLQQFSNATDKFLPNSSARNQTALGWTENMGSGTSVLQDGSYSGQLIFPSPLGTDDTNLPAHSIGTKVCENPPSIDSSPPVTRSGKSSLHKVKAGVLKREKKSRHLQVLQNLPKIRIIVSSKEIHEDWMKIMGHKYEGPRQTTNVPKGTELCKALLRPQTLKYLDEIDFNN